MSPLTGCANSSGGFAFEDRIRGDHHIFSRSDIPEIINLQPKGTKAKPIR